ncbi:MAG TPA: tRNA dimethylallyltransferase, partial [Patescibacteria group bacterium]|nr:tRNA dimethylallyltransferase [Patescibacteria group bacterium]
RALEVVLTKQSSFKSLQKIKKPRYEVLQIGLWINREMLNKRIEKRFKQMVNIGLVEETKALLRTYSTNLPSMSGIGYAEIGRYLHGEISLKLATELAVIRSRQYAKRQMTWFKKDPRILWISKPQEATKITRFFLNK